MKLQFKKLSPDAVAPIYATPGAACFDLSACLPASNGPSEIQPGQSVAVPTKLAFEVPPGKVLKIYSRSGHAAKFGVRLSNCVGIVDSDYRGEVVVLLTNDGRKDFFYSHGDRIAQAVLEDALQAEFVEVGILSETKRGAGGFGSTGTK